MNRTPDEWAALAEERLSRKGVGDSFQPAFMTIDANGKVTFDFSGHIKAEGLDLPTDVDFTIADDEMVRWLHPDDNTEQARVWGALTTASDLAQVLLWANRNGLHDWGNASLRASGPNKTSQVEVRSHSVTQDGNVKAQAGKADVGVGLQTRVIIDGSENSDYLQLGSDIGSGDRKYLSHEDIVAIPAMGAGASAVVNGKTWTIINGDGPVGGNFQFFGWVQSGVALPASWGVITIPTNTATQFTIQFRFANPYSVALGAGAQNLRYSIICDKQLI